MTRIGVKELGHRELRACESQESNCNLEYHARGIQWNHETYNVQPSN